MHNNSKKIFLIKPNARVGYIASYNLNCMKLHQSFTEIFNVYQRFLISFEQRNRYIN